LTPSGCCAGCSVEKEPIASAARPENDSTLPDDRPIIAQRPKPRRSARPGIPSKSSNHPFLRKRQRKKKMSKSHDTRKQTKKAPQKSLKEKRAEKRAKKSG
jgi:hypothetical protein